jgi:urea transport system substrate-binding protein
LNSHPEQDEQRSPPRGSPDDRTLIGVEGDTVAPPGRLGGGHQWIGKTLGRYRLTGLLGGGGMGVVYRAHDEVIARDVAVKVLPPELASDPTASARFMSEARAAGQLSHPNAVGIYEAGVQDGAHYIVMEVVSGGSLAEEVRRIGPLSPVAATRAITEATRGVAAAHATGMVHRDIKPANLLRSADGTIKVCDFGLAKGGVSELSVTKAGHVVGTPYYMSPEQCQGRPVDVRSDIYSLGATYFFLLTGIEPYADAGSTVQVMFAHCHGEPLDPFLLNQLVPEQCAAIVRRACAKDPAERYASTAEMLRDLESALGGMSGGRSGSQTRLSLSNADRTRLAPESSHAANQSTKRTPIRPRWMLAAAGITIIAMVVGAMWMSGGRQTSDGQTAGGAASDVGDSSAVADGSGNHTLPVPASGEPIKIGVLHSLSGSLSDSESPIVDAVLLAIEEVNRAGGVGGRPLKAVIADGRSDTRVFLSEAERLIDAEKVPVVFGCWTSATRKTLVPLFEDRDHLLVYPVQHEGLAESPNVFYTGATPNQQILPAIKWAVDTLHAKRFFLVGNDSVFPRAASAIIKDAAPSLGIEIVGEDYLPPAARSASATAALISSASPDVILNMIDGNANVLFFDALRRAEVRAEKTPTISFRIEEEGIRRLNASAVAGDYAAWTYFQSIDSPENKTFVTSFHERYGPQRTITDPMECAYVGLKLWAAAANEAGNVEPRRVRQSLRSQRLQAPEGTVRVDPVSQHLFKTPRVGQIGSDGRFKIVWTADQPIPPEPYPATRSAEAWKAFLRDLQREWGGRWAAPGDEP